MYANRRELYEQLGKFRNSNVITYVTSTRVNQAHSVEKSCLDFFPFHLDALSPANKISLILHTDGGDIIIAWSLVNLLRMFCKKFEVIVPSRAMSAGTIIALGADTIVMTKQGVLGAIDPSTNSPFNPIINGNNQSISVENVDSYFKLAHDKLGNNANIEKVFFYLTQHVNPIALGNIYRAQNQIRMLSEKLLCMHMQNKKDDIKKIIDFLCSASGSHDYTISRREAMELGLPIEEPNTETYEIINNIYTDICEEMLITSPYYEDIELNGFKENTFRHVRGLIESVNFGSHKYIYSGRISENRGYLPLNLSWIKEE